jgi:hypothetical protein
MRAYGLLMTSLPISVGRMAGEPPLFLEDSNLRKRGLCDRSLRWCLCPLSGLGRLFLQSFSTISGIKGDSRRQG